MQNLYHKLSKFVLKWVGKTILSECNTLHRETFPLSLWWEFRSETWYEKTYWKTVWSKIVIWSIQVSWDVTYWHSSTYQQTWIVTYTRLLDVLMQLFWSFLLYVCVYFIYFQYECVLQKYPFLLNSVPQLVCCQKQLGFCNYF